MKLGLIVLLSLASFSPHAQRSAPNKVIDPRDVIALEAGIWDALILTPSRAAGGKPSTATGVQVNELRSGGLWMLNRMSVSGGAYEGTGIWGFDPKTGRYSGYWVDSGTARIRMDDGRWNPDTMTMTWTSLVQQADGKTRKLRATSTFSGNRRTYRSFAVTNSGEVPLNTVIFTRRSD
jgi:hypothetical protein